MLNVSKNNLNHPLKMLTNKKWNLVLRPTFSLNNPILRNTGVLYNQFVKADELGHNSAHDMVRH